MSDKADNEPKQGAASGESGSGVGGAPSMTINAQYVKDLSFEAPGVPRVFAQMQNRPPDIAVNVDVQARVLESAVYEVALHIRADCKSGDLTAFLVELSYGGVFTLNVPAADLRPVLLIECPRLLFPFARHIVATVTSNGGFPPLMLGPIDFASLYQRQLRDAEPAAEDETAARPPH